jgi:hypothetical protein
LPAQGKIAKKRQAIMQAQQSGVRKRKIGRGYQMLGNRGRRRRRRGRGNPNAPLAGLIR